ncbi:MAG TPA: hypothetical protein PLC42_05165 [Parachlamydiaceae bacterium]|nr:hypothetical protein [Parachlamydiaceae bacterium]
MKKLIFAILTAACLFQKAFAFDASPPCFRDLEVNFFQPAIVNQAFSIHGVDQSVWVPILQNLQIASKEVPALLRERGKKMSPDPFDPVFIPEIAFELLNETLFEIFANVIATYNPNQVLRLNGNDIWNMYQYISNEQSKKIERCFPKK